MALAAPCPQRFALAWLSDIQCHKLANMPSNIYSMLSKQLKNIPWVKATDQSTIFITYGQQWIKL
jgi:hypothetical protein